MTDAQTWTLIGVFATSMVAVIGLVLRLVRAEIGMVRADVATGFAQMNGRFDAMSTRFDHLDRDVQLLMRRAVGDPAE